jgi:hypothetical protein
MDSFRASFVEALPAYMQVKFASGISNQFGVSVYLWNKPKNGEDNPKGKPHFTLARSTVDDSLELACHHMEIDLDSTRLKVFSLKIFIGLSW